MLPQNLGSETNVKLPFSFIFFSILALVLSQLLLLLKGQMIATGGFRIPVIWSSAHLIILGWALMAAMGAMYQLVPVAFLTKIWNERFGFLQFYVTAAGILSFSGLLYWQPQKVMIPGLLTLLGILMFLFQMFMTLKSQKEFTILTLFVGTALICLLLTIMLGITMVIFITTGTGSEYYSAIFESHLLLGLAGWFTLLIFGFSYKMVPMFALSHGFTMRPAKYVYTLYVLGLLVTLISFFTGISILLKVGFFLLLAGFSCFSLHIKKILTKRLKRKLDKPFIFSILSILFGNMIHLASFVLVCTGPTTPNMGLVVYSYLFLWIVLSILGYLFKIVPFLWWTYKYSKEIGKTAVPTLKEMINEKITIPLFSTFSLSVLMLILSMLLKSTQIFNIGQFSLSLVFIIFSFNILSVFKK